MHRAPARQRGVELTGPSRFLKRFRVFKGFAKVGYSFRRQKRSPRAPRERESFQRDDEAEFVYRHHPIRKLQGEPVKPILPKTGLLVRNLKQSYHNSETILLATSTATQPREPPGAAGALFLSMGSEAFRPLLLLLPADARIRQDSTSVLIVLIPEESIWLGSAGIDPVAVVDQNFCFIAG